MEAIDTDKTLYHGVTYNPEIDKKRFTGQLQRIAEVLSNGQEYDSQALCTEANVSFSALRNRISDLRVYHAFKISAERIKDGLWKYKYLGRMTPDEHKKYLKGLREIKPIGNEILFGEMFRTIYAYAHQADMVNLANMEASTVIWAKDMAAKIREDI